MRMAAALRNDLKLRERHVGALATALSHLDPTRVLGRGYSIVRNSDGSIRHTSAGLRSGAAVDITFSRGGATATVTGVRPESD
jgi:exodeoxyribonuclease VII large subunit